MPYSPAFSTAVTREAAWFTTDPPTGSQYAWTGPPPPPLLKANGGVFDVVQAYPRKYDKRGRELYISRERVEEERIAMGGEKEWRHHMLATIFWALESHTGRFETDLQSLDTAIDAVLQRIRGPLLDNSHGGSFVDCEEGMSVEYGDVLAERESRRAITVVVRWIALDTFVA